MTVFANKREISAEKQGCKVIAAFPDTCFTPPENPATPPGVPIPYPNFGMDSDLTKGSGTVKIKDGAISQENSSHYKKCSGDEAGSAAKKGVITSKNTGKVYAQAWSSDVKVEGKGVVRLGDLATTNHMSNTGDGGTMVLVGKPGGIGFEDSVNCLVGSYSEIVKKCNERGGEAHHIIPDEYVRKGTRENSKPAHKTFPTIADACAICVGGKASGKANAERTSDVGKKIAKKADDFAKATEGAKSMAGARGHGYMHYFFDGSMGNNPKPISEAVELAKQSCVNAAAYDGSVIDKECAAKACECLDEQYKDACAVDPPLKVKAKGNKTKQRFDNAAERLNQEGHLKDNLKVTLDSSF
ncbi:DUF4150 domain-containing protein [Aestuariicoccus sp. MJ-SS9]|uniref:DUF4150 domain-containing protein n=1 Tax=Aestuariicoccus sp. MJ-SS9 TaxID=3079855 RepID=UPI00290D117E|nr:DUF4150 domain-containing protein [Aestuariicoccus sp. MJ-SS9]MDU8910053.1 DUF4150 domain-containing protein [Aestuariicoccus sp. MJ-SS9]